ncbi:cytochrome bd-type quinol oxidase subunit 2 [Arthrobacter sp. PL16]|nr:cytochrome bd-type quinol oxidase subunit 2 [Arthrobacter sp. PL16]
MTGIPDGDESATRRYPGASASDTDGVAPSRATGPGRLLIAVYGVFALAASARAGFQIATKFSEAPVAYLLSAVAAIVYIVATVSLARPGTRAYRISVVAVTTELVGVIAVGLLSIFDAQAFPSETVWSAFGRGYGFVPLILPVLGLIWLRRNRPGRSRI